MSSTASKKSKRPLPDPDAGKETEKEPEKKTFPISILLCFLEGDGSDRDEHIVLQFVPTAQERTLLTLYASNPVLQPVYHQGANAAYALGSYFNYKYGEAEWKAGDPLSTRKEANESDEEVCAFLRQRAATRKRAYTYTIVTQFVQFQPTSLILEILEEYLTFLRLVLANSTELALMATETPYRDERTLGLLLVADNPSLLTLVKTLKIKKFMLQ